jgi:signal transduction histidine kinase
MGGILLTATLCFGLCYSNGYSKQVPVSFEVAPDVCDAVITDEEWLWQMLLNLLTNACKYTDRGNIEMRLSVTSDPAVKMSSMSSDATTVVQNLPPPLSLPESRSTDMLLCEVIDTGERAMFFVSE